MMTQINIEEAHTILLGIAKVFAKVCEDNDIPYYMLGGTMLGAIRHKGFIPWDDDMDFGVPREFYDKLIICLEKQLPYPYRCCTYKNGLAQSAIFKIDDSRTIINERHNKTVQESFIGLNIDIFPLDYCSPGDRVIKQIKMLTYIYRAKYSKNPQWSKMRHILNQFVDLIIPWPKIKVIETQECLLKKLKSGPYLSNVYGAWGEKECIPVEWYGAGVKYKFEDTEFCGIESYDNYLHQLYGDYMLPPKGERHIHLDGVYWK